MLILLPIRLALQLLESFVYCILAGTDYFRSLGIPYFISFFLGLIVSPLILAFSIIVGILKFISYPFRYINDKKIKSSRKENRSKYEKSRIYKTKKTKRS